MLYYALKLVFYSSPYPPSEEWKRDTPGRKSVVPDEFEFWESKEFCGEDTEVKDEIETKIVAGSPEWIQRLMGTS